VEPVILELVVLVHAGHEDRAGVVVSVDPHAPVVDEDHVRVVVARSVAGRAPIQGEPVALALRRVEPADHDTLLLVRGRHRGRIVRIRAGLHRFSPRDTLEPRLRVEGLSLLGGNAACHEEDEEDGRADLHGLSSRSHAQQTADRGGGALGPTAAP
jgi:hypothetical protein